MTFEEKQLAILENLITERATYPGWELYYDRKIAELREAIYGPTVGIVEGL